MEFNVASPFEAITGSDVFLDGSLPYPMATVSSVVFHNITSQSGFWRTESSFISHYLQSLSSQAQSLYSLGPLVSAQRVVFPPAPSSSGDSALR